MCGSWKGEMFSSVVRLSDVKMKIQGLHASEQRERTSLRHRMCTATPNACDALNEVARRITLWSCITCIQCSLFFSACAVRLSSSSHHSSIVACVALFCSIVHVFSVFGFSLSPNSIPFGLLVYSQQWSFRHAFRLHSNVTYNFVWPYKIYSIERVSVSSRSVVDRCAHSVCVDRFFFIENVLVEIFSHLHTLKSTRNLKSLNCSNEKKKNTKYLLIRSSKQCLPNSLFKVHEIEIYSC